MNERIRLLAEQADGVFIHKLMTGAKQYTFLEKDLENFAELIVQECILAVQFKIGRGKVDDYYRGQYDSVAAIKEHFGVKE